MLKETFFFQFNFKNQFSPIIAFKSQAEGGSLWLVCHVPFPLISRLFGYCTTLQMSISGRKFSPNQNPVTHHPAAPKQLDMPGSIPVKVHEVCVGAALHSLIKSTHRSPITPVQGYLKSQDVYRLFPRSANAAPGFAMGVENQSHEMRE